LEFSSGERLALPMLCDIQGALKIDRHDTTMLREALAGGHHWAIDSQYRSKLADAVDTRIVETTNDILDAWDFVEQSFEALDAEDRARYHTATGHRPSPRFAGFDARTEAPYLSVARMMAKTTGRWTRFAERELDCRSPNLVSSLRVVEACGLVRANLDERLMGVDDLVTVALA
jgi:uncharacterized protein YfbU (UPF0304 family)